MKNSRIVKRQQIYALYDGDTWIWDGTVKDLSIYTGRSYESLIFLTYKSVKEKIADDYQFNGHRLVIIEMDEGEY